MLDIAAITATDFFSRISVERFQWFEPWRVVFILNSEYVTNTLLLKNSSPYSIFMFEKMRNGFREILVVIIWTKIGTLTLNMQKFLTEMCQNLSSTRHEKLIFDYLYYCISQEPLWNSTTVITVQDLRSWGSLWLSSVCVRYKIYFR